jgi:hypothetical protein
VLGAALLIGTMALVSSPARAASAATSVSDVTVTNTAPSTAAGALTNYTIGFQTSTSGALSGSAASFITIILPKGTGLSELNGSVVVDGTNVADCSNESTSSVVEAQCFIFSSDTVATSTAVTVNLDGVTNPITPSTTDTVKVSTSSDTTVVTSPHYSVTGAHGVSNVTVTNTLPSTAAGALTSYTIRFKTSSSGALSGSAGSFVTIRPPSSSVLTDIIGGSVVAGGRLAGDCRTPTTSRVVRCYIATTVAARTAVVVTLAGVTNPTTPSSKATVKVFTSSDTTAVTSHRYSVTAAQAVSDVTVTNTPPSTAAGALTNYTIGFQTSTSGALSGSAGSFITITMPNGTGFSELNGSVVVGGTMVGFCVPNDVVPEVQCDVLSGVIVATSAAVTVDLDGVTDATTPSATDTVTVSTSSDTTAVTSPPYPVTAARGVSNVTVALSSTLAHKTGVTYRIRFTTSSTGELDGSAGDFIDVKVPAGTGMGELTSTAVTDDGRTVGDCAIQSLTQEQCSIFDGATVKAGDEVTVTLVGVTNPKRGSYQLKVSTSSDVTTIKSPAYRVFRP